jgi:hypothetical protein
VAGMMAMTAVLALAALFVTPRSDTDAEMARLRQALGLAADAKLQLAPSASLPEAAVRTVALEAGLDTRVRDNVARWAEEWNKKDGARHGQLRIVPVRAEAALVLVYLVDEDKARSTTQTFTTGTSQTGTGRPDRRSFQVYQAPVRAYVLRAVEGGYEIVWREAGYTPVERTNGTGRELWDAFRKLLKQKR